MEHLQGRIDCLEDFVFYAALKYVFTLVVL